MEREGKSKLQTGSKGLGTEFDLITYRYLADKYGDNVPVHHTTVASERINHLKKADLYPGVKTLGEHVKALEALASRNREK